MLTIKNVDKAIGMMCYGRSIYHVSNHTNALSESAYVFEFDAINDGTGYNKPQEIHLIRNEGTHSHDRGTYRLFCMGLQLGTERKVHLSEVKCLTSLLVEISEVLRKTKYWWDKSNLKNKV
jgi:hypothetical protein